MPLPCPLLQQKKISAAKDSSRLQLTTRSMHPGACSTMIYLVGPGSQQRRGSHKGGHRQRDAPCPLQSTERARQRKAGGHKSRSRLGNVMLASLCYTLSGGISLKGTWKSRNIREGRGKPKRSCSSREVQKAVRDHCCVTSAKLWDALGTAC